MRVKELYSAVAGITGDNALESPKWFYQALNRSVAQLTRIRPREKSFTFEHRVPKPIISRQMNLNADETFEVTGDIATVALAVVGAVTVTASDGETEKTEQIKGLLNKVEYRLLCLENMGITPESVTLTITADRASKIEQLSCYDADAGVVPFFNGDYYGYDASVLAQDFQRFADMPLRDLHVEEPLYRFVENEIRVPKDADQGLLTVYYYAAPCKIKYDDHPEEDYQTIDIGTDMTDLLELLCAYYCNVYSEPEMAETILRDYNNQLAMFLRNSEVPREETLTDATGWLN